MNEHQRAYIGIGSNLEDPLQQVKTAIAELAELDLEGDFKASRLYRSKPLGPLDQPDFVNAVVVLGTRLIPRALLKTLQGIEETHGRRRDGQVWGPRSLDLDILIYADSAIMESDLLIPHPGLYERAFVLYPLHDIEPDLVLPDGRRLEAVMAGSSSQGLEVIEE